MTYSLEGCRSIQLSYRTLDRVVFYGQADCKGNFF